MPTNRDPSAAPGELAHVSLALVNSRRNTPAGPLDELASSLSLRGWLSAHGFAVRRCRADDVAAFRELRDAVRELLLARIEGRLPDDAALGVINRNAAAAPATRQINWTVEGPAQVSDYLGAEGLALARALISADAIELVAEAAHVDLRACAAPGCLRLLLRDHPRRHWCSTRCGDRVRASRYYHRHHAAREHPAP